VTSTASADWRAAAIARWTHCCAPGTRAYAIPARPGPAATPAGWSENATIPRRVPLACQHARRARGLDIGSRADPSDTGGAKVIDRVEQCVLAVVERVVVSERDAVHAEVCEQLDGARRGAEEERLVWRWPAATACRDAALEIKDAQVALAHHRSDGVGDQRGRVRRERIGDPSAEHRVAGERESHRYAYLP
jgi:hypothetical protein